MKLSKKTSIEIIGLKLRKSKHNGYCERIYELEKILPKIEQLENLTENLFKIVEAYCKDCKDKNCDCCIYVPFIHDYIEYMEDEEDE